MPDNKDDTSKEEVMASTEATPEDVEAKEESAVVAETRIEGEEEEDKKKEDETKDSSSSTAAPEAKKKRTAERQITKDDRDGDDDDDDDDDDGIDRNAPFSRASEEVLAKRRIVKVKRPEPTAKSSNPFASTTLLTTSSSGNGATNGATNGSSSTTNTTTTTSTSKVFGSGSAFSGFGAAAAKAGGTTGFGSSAASGGGAVTGFGAFGSVTASGGGFGKPANGSSTSEQPKTTGFGSTSLFSTTNSSGGKSGGGSGFTFGFAKPISSSSPTKDASTSSTGSGGGGGGTGSALCKLPDRVELTTGEEDEENLHEVRCKSFKWAKVESKKKKKSDGGESASGDNKNASSIDEAINGAAAPSVKPSSNFENMAAESNKDGDEDGDDDSKKDTHRWQELGIGPLKILLNTSTGKYRLVQRRESTPNGNAHKVILNLPLWKETQVEKQSEKHLSLFTLTAAGENERYTLKFKEAYQALTTWSELQHRIPMAKSCFATTTTTTTSETKEE